MQVRYDRHVGPEARLKFMTDGILLRELQVSGLGIKCRSVNVPSQGLDFKGRFNILKLGNIIGCSMPSHRLGIKGIHVSL